MTEQQLIEKKDLMQQYIDFGCDDYMVRNLYMLYDQCIKVNQLMVPSDKPVACKKVVQIKRVLPVEVLKLSHPELIVWEGVYMVVEGIMIPKSILKEIGFYGRRKLDSSSLPPDYMYGTLKDTGRYGFAFKNQDITNYINNSSGWQLFNIDDDN